MLEVGCIWGGLKGGACVLSCPCYSTCFDMLLLIKVVLFVLSMFTISVILYVCFMLNCSSILDLKNLGLVLLNSSL